MPIYEYQCKKCGHEFERMQSITEDKKPRCEKCKGGVEKLISSSSFSLKGGGWYSDGYEKKPKKKTTEKSEGSLKSPKKESNKQDTPKKKKVT